jgi:tRNA pseudouridine55 synthase
MNGILAIDKPIGITSHDVVAKVRKILRQRRVGHAGTLDPAASGVLPICTGQATRVAEYLSESGKEYRASIVFGVETETYDAEGAIIQTADTQMLSLSGITEALEAFVGQQMQMPPRYSAIKIQGQAAYKRVRAGEEVVLQRRPIEIFHLTIVHWQPPVLVLDVACSKGTYIRSLAHDLGHDLGCGAHLGGLTRTKSGPFRLAECITLEELEAAMQQNTVADCFQPADRALEQYPALQPGVVAEEQIRHGNAFTCESAEGERSLARVYTIEGSFIAIAAWEPLSGKWQPKKVFSESENASA